MHRKKLTLNLLKRTQEVGRDTGYTDIFFVFSPVPPGKFGAAGTSVRPAVHKSRMPGRPATEFMEGGT
jgi:hypothetical protein